MVLWVNTVLCFSVFDWLQLDKALRLVGADWLLPRADKVVAVVVQVLHRKDR